ncbi:hypothetical protein SLEP1_g58869 [Rubroshorea leprosula]|uniref:Uncharacterized protein n=1 Tax=Rubroshorea leprosula TaxID=152421 RepID=A0AAV5MQP1_9ROSI|nr:hypothetical protein SLEP1_g58869 [Rubroshorea leprosula]
MTSGGNSVRAATRDKTRCRAQSQLCTEPTTPRLQSSGQPHETRQGAELRANHTSAAELRANRTSALRRGCMTATIGTPSSDHSSVPEHPFSRNLLRQNAPRAFNAVAPLRHVTPT